MTLLKGDCLELMKKIPDGSVDLVLTDPPYGTMKGIDDKHDWDTILDTQTMFAEISRILRQNGKAILFSQEPYTSHIIQNAVVSLPFCYRAIWLKNSSGNCRMAKSAMISLYEDICIFSKPYDPELKNELRKYFQDEKKKSGLTLNELNNIMGYPSKGGGYASHYFTNGTQFSLPTEKHYLALQKTGYFKKPYEEIRYLFAKYQPTFNLWQGGKSKSNVLEYKKDNDGYHPTQKPVALLEDLIKTYSNEGNTVLDFTMGSGSTGVACVNTGRDFIGIELDENYFNIAKERIGI
jgi:site-specific DNA-methyltransferase (adenine-specific)